MRIKAHKFEDLLARKLKNKGFRDEYERLEPEFALAKEIILLRKKRNLTQAQLAKKMHTSQPAIARVESGNYQNLTLKFIDKLANALEAKPIIHLKAK